MNRLSVLIILVLFGCKTSSLTQINIEAKNEISFDNKTPCLIEIYDANTKYNLDAKIEARGGISRRYAKKSYEITFKDKISIGQLTAQKNYILNSSYIDKTLMRHKIGFALFNEMSANNKASKCLYTTLEYNGEYKGIYVLMEAVNSELLELSKNDSLAMIFKDPPVFIQDSIKYVESKNNYYQQKFPKINNSNKSYYLNEFKAFLFNTDDLTFAQNIEKWIDLKNITDWHLLLLFSNNGDGVLKNFYLYKQNSKTPFRIAIWDFDHSFGRDGDNELNNTNPEIAFERSILLKRLFDNPYLNYRNKLKLRWEFLRKNEILSSKNFEKHIAINSKIITNEREKNFDKWPLDGEYYFDNNSHEKEIEIMIDFVNMNIKKLDHYFKMLK